MSVISWIYATVFEWLHAIVDAVTCWTRLNPNRQVGWKSWNRKTGKLEREQQPLTKKLKLLLLFNPITEWLDTTHAMRLHIHRRTERSGVQESSPKSRKQIRSFVESYGIKMEDFDPSDISEYSSFEAFFTRKHKPGSRPIFEKDDMSAAVVVADSRVVAFPSVAASKRLWIKGSDFSVTELVMDTQLGAAFEDGAIASFRLSPQDYHRYHSPVSGRVKLFRSVPGDYYQVDPVALRSDVNILTQNRRSYVVIETVEFGDVLFVAIGATDVGSVQFRETWKEKGSRIQKGEEIGVFQYGGSSIIVGFQNGRIQFDDDLLELSQAQIQVSVEVGMSLGHAVKL